MLRFICNTGQQRVVFSCFRSHTFSTTTTDIKKPIRPEYPAPVRHGFIPEEWFAFFYRKTGVSGPYIFATGVSTYLLSKEIYIMDHSFNEVLGFTGFCIFLIKKYGSVFSKFLDKQIDAYENSFESSRNTQIKDLKELIDYEKKEQWQTEGQKMVIDIKKDNINMQLEAVYRERLSSVYQEVKQRLDYQVQIQNIERKLAQKYMIQWIVENVRKAITPEQEKIVLSRCITDLQNLINKA